MMEGKEAGTGPYRIEHVASPQARPALISEISTLLHPPGIEHDAQTGLEGERKTIAFSVSPNQRITMGKMAMPGMARKKSWAG